MASEKEFEVNDPWYDAFIEMEYPDWDTDRNEFLPDEDLPDEETPSKQEDFDESYNNFRGLKFKSARLRAKKDQKQQQVSEFYQVINALTGKTLKDKFSLFLALANIQQFNKNTFTQLQTAIAQENIKQTAEYLQKYYTLKQWHTPSNGETALEQFNINPSYLQYTYKNQLSLIGKALSHLNHYYGTEQKHQNLYQDLLDFIRKHADAFTLFDLDFDFKRFIHHILDYYDFKENAVVQDGCAGLGILTREMLYPQNSKPVLHLETSDPLLAQIGQQLLAIKNHNQENTHATYKVNNPLNGTFGFKKNSADFYISCPQMPYKLNDNELKAAFNFTQIHYNGTIARYASDALWVQYALHCLKPTGLGLIVVQDGFLRRSGYDAAVRKHLIDNKILTAVISIHSAHARQSQYNQVSLLILNKNPKTNTVNKDVYFANMRELPANLGLGYTDDDSQANWSALPFLDEAGKEGNLLLYGLDTVDFEKSTTEIANNDYNLSFEFYQGIQQSSDYPKLEIVTKAFNDAKNNMNQSLALFEESLNIDKN